MKMTKNLYAVSLEMMLVRMIQQAGPSPHPGTSAILADMRRLVDSVTSLATIAENPDAEASQEARQAKVIRSASRLVAALPTVAERLVALVASTEAGFTAAFAQHSGLVTTERASEIRAHLKGLRDAGERALFVQERLKANDNESLGAVVFSPPYLSGLDAVTHNRLREQIEKERLPELAKNREVFSELSGNLRVALNAASKAVAEFSNPRLLADMEQRAAQAKAAEERLAASTLPVGGL